MEMISFSHLATLLLVSFIMIQPCHLIDGGSNQYCPVQRKVVFIRQVISIFDKEQDAFDQLVNIMFSKSCITSISTLALDDRAKIHHFQDWEQFQSVPTDSVHLFKEEIGKRYALDINGFVIDRMVALESQKRHNTDNTVFIIAIRTRVSVYRDLVSTFKGIFGDNVKLVFLCVETSLPELFPLVPLHRIIILWNDLDFGSNSHGIITDLALNPDYDRYKMAEYLVPDTTLTESCFMNKNNSTTTTTPTTTTTTTTITVLYVWLIYTPLYFPKPELTPLVQLLMFLRRKLREVGARLEIVTHAKNNNLRVAFESLDFLCHAERMRSYVYGFGGYDYQELFSELIPKYNSKNTDQKTNHRAKTLHLNINKYGTPRTTLAQFTQQLVSIRYITHHEKRDFRINGDQLNVHPLNLATDELLESLLKILDEKACDLSKF